MSIKNFLPIKNSVLGVIKEKYQIVDLIDLAECDMNPEDMAATFSKYVNSQFSDTQRVVVLCHETDYYPELTAVGNTVFNFLRICSNYNISLDHIIFLTNHYGIKEEIIRYSEIICNSPPPNVIYTSQWFSFPDITDLTDRHRPFNYKYLYCCLNGCQRQHRIMTLCMLQEHGLLDRGLLSYHFGK